MHRPIVFSFSVHASWQPVKNLSDKRAQRSSLNTSVLHLQYSLQICSVHDPIWYYWSVSLHRSACMWIYLLEGNFYTEFTLFFLKNSWSAWMLLSNQNWVFLYQMLCHHLSIYCMRLVMNHIYKMKMFYSLIDIYELDIEFINFVITKLEYRQKSEHVVSQDTIVWKPSWRHCVVLLSEFMLICARSWWLSSLYFRIIKWTSNRDDTCNHDENI
jgi:hypothetical protein